LYLKKGLFARGLRHKAGGDGQSTIQATSQTKFQKESNRITKGKLKRRER